MRKEKRNVKETELVEIKGTVKTKELEASAAAHPPAYTRDDIHEKLALGQWNVEEPERWDGMS
jgi:hypothetical protein